MADSENKAKKIDWKGVIGGVTSFFSIVFLAFAPNWFSAIAGSPYVAIILFISLLVCVRFREKEWAKSALYLIVPLCITSFISFGKTWLTERSANRGELVADATESLVQEYLDEGVTEWFEDALESGDLVCFLLPSTSLKDDAGFLYDVNDIEKYRAVADSLPSNNLQTKICHYDNKNTKKETRAKYLLGYANRRFLKDGWDRKYDVEILPGSTQTVIHGVKNLSHNRWEAAGRLFSQADSAGNAAGTKWLARWFSSGYGQAPDTSLYLSNLEKAAVNGSRGARYVWSESVLKDKASSAVSKARAEDFLKRAASLKTLVTLATINYSEKSIQLLNKYYVSTGQNLKAYYCTRRYLRTFDDPYIRYSEHLANCLALGFNREALRIVRDGEKISQPNCFYIHGLMYAKGVAERKDPEKAEALLRYASDSLHYSKAYRGLAWLYDNTGRDGAEFWYMMYMSDFNDEID